MKRAPAFQLWAGDLLADTLDWTDEEVGAHIRLLCWSWINRRGIPREHPRMERIAPSSVRCWSTIGRLWEEGPEETWVNRELEERRQESDSFRKAQRRKSELAQVAKREKLRNSPADSSTGVSVGPSLKEGEGDGIGIGGSRRKDASADVISSPPGPVGPQPIPFATFWDAYAKKIDRPKCEAKWAKLTPVEQAAALAYASRYVKVTQGDKERYRRHPETFLNNRNWESEDLIRQHSQNLTEQSRVEASNASVMKRDQPQPTLREYLKEKQSLPHA